MTAAGAVYSWGRGVNGQLGHGDTTAITTEPRFLASLSRGHIILAAFSGAENNKDESFTYVTPTQR